MVTACKGLRILSLQICNQMMTDLSAVKNIVIDRTGNSQFQADALILKLGP
jgi:hypothetical protein